MIKEIEYLIKSKVKYFEMMTNKGPIFVKVD